MWLATFLCCPPRDLEVCRYEKGRHFMLFCLSRAIVSFIVHDIIDTFLSAFGRDVMSVPACGSGKFAGLWPN